MAKITDDQVLAACSGSQANQGRPRTIDYLMTITGQSHDDCLDALYRAQDDGLISQGNPRWAYPRPRDDMPAPIFRGGKVLRP